MKDYRTVVTFQRSQRRWRSSCSLASQIRELSSRRCCEVQRIKFWLEFTDSHTKESSEYLMTTRTTLREQSQSCVVCIACAWGTLHEAYCNEVIRRWWRSWKSNNYLCTWCESTYKLLLGVSTVYTQVYMYIWTYIHKYGCTYVRANVHIRLSLYTCKRTFVYSDINVHV